MKKVCCINAYIMQNAPSIKQLVGVPSTVVYFESPHPQDVQEGRMEYHSVGSMLRLMNIPCYPVAIAGKAQLKEKLQELPSVVQLKASSQVFLHFSSHGNKQGIELYSGEFVSWDDFTDILSTWPLEFKNKLTLCFSTCEGLGSQLIGKGKWNPQYRYTVAPYRKVEWGESAVAFAVFYYLHVVRGIVIESAISAMNLIALRESDINEGQYDVYACIPGTVQATVTRLKNPTVHAGLAKLFEMITDAKNSYDRGQRGSSH